MIETISHGLYRPAADRDGDQPSWAFAVATAQRTLTVGTTDIPGPIG